jgi:DNA uptake protein ComE-like DNA-binding protein
MRQPQTRLDAQALRRLLLRGALALSGTLGAVAAAAAALVVVTPVLVDGHARLQAEPGGTRQVPVVRALSGELAQALAREARSGATAFALELDAAAQALQGRQVPQPTYLLVSDEQGGFARQGLWLVRGAAAPEWHGDPYVNLAVDADSIADGSFEEIFAHEMGHVLLRRLLPGLPSGYSRVPHSSLAVTDYPTAFDEGFAEHFQPLARQLTRNVRLRLADAGFGIKPFVPYFRDSLDRSLRIRGVRDNLFVQRQQPWPEPLAASPDATTLFDPGALKNGQQMMASEGVIATLFYHLLDQPERGTGARRARYAQLLRTLQSLNAQPIEPSTPVFLRLVEQQVRAFPQSRSHWLSTVVGLTYGATVDERMARLAAELALFGRQGDAEKFVARLAPARKALLDCTEAVLRDPSKLGAALGPELWAAATDALVPLPATPLSADPLPAAVNLNTAERSSLMLWLRLDAASAERALASRRDDGPFSDLGDFARRAGITAEREALLRAGAARVAAAGPFARE